MYRGLLVNHEKVVKFLNFICGGKIKLWGKFSGICQVNPNTKEQISPRGPPASKESCPNINSKSWRKCLTKFWTWLCGYLQLLPLQCSLSLFILRCVQRFQVLGSFHDADSNSTRFDLRCIISYETKVNTFLLHCAKSVHT